MQALWVLWALDTALVPRLLYHIQLAMTQHSTKILSHFTLQAEMAQQC